MKENLKLKKAFGHLRGIAAAFVLSCSSGMMGQSVSYNHDAAKMNQITVMEIGSGGLTPSIYYDVLHRNYSKSAARKNKLSFRTLAGINLYNQVDEAEALDSALTKRAEIEALNVADRSGGALDLAWVAEGGKLTAKMEDFERNINRILQAGGTANEQSHWKEHYNMYQCAIKVNKTRLYHRNRWAYGLMMQTSFPLFLGIHSEILGIYSSKRLGGATDVLGANYQVNIGFQKKFLNDRAIVKLSMSDIFWTSNWDNVNKFDGFESINYGYGETRLVRLNFTFKFGSNKKNYLKESKIESEINRL